MIVVIATLSARPDTVDAVTAIALAHVHESRREAGCISHEVARDVERPLRFVFTERWIDMGALAAHAGHPPTQEAVQQLTGLIEAETSFDVYDVTVQTM